MGPERFDGPRSGGWKAPARSRGQASRVAGHRTAAGGLLLALFAILLGIAAVTAGLRM